MPRTNANGLELSFHPTSRRWYKSGKHEFPNVPGHRVYFGAGRSVTDRESYKAALARYQAHKDQQADARRRAESIDHLKELLAATSDPHGQWDVSADRIRQAIGRTDYASTAPEVADAFGEVADRQEKREILADLGADLDQLPLDQLRQATVRVDPQAPTGNKYPTVAALVDQFLVVQEQRNATLKTLEAKKAAGEKVDWTHKEYVGSGRLTAIRRDTKQFKAELGAEAWDGREATAAKLLAKWRAESERLFNTGRHKVGTFNERMKIGHQIIQWAYKAYELDGLPRNLNQLCKKYNHVSTAKAIPLADLKIIWEKADDTLRTWIALGLNCGYYAQDLADLTAPMLVDGYLDHTRGKSGVNVRYKLWNVTKELIARNRNDDGTGNVFRTRNGCPLVNHAERGRSDAVSQRFQGLIAEKLGWLEPYTDPKTGKERQKARYTWSNVRDTGTTAMANVAPEFADMYDAHKDSRMARFYEDGKHIKTEPFDEALAKLEAYFGLPLPLVKAKKPKPSKATA